MLISYIIMNLIAYDHFDRFFKFCYTCWTFVGQGKLPRFGTSNKIPQIYCQDYLEPLISLISANKAIIVRTHLVVTILKLRPNNKFNSGLYKSVRGYFVLLSQNPDLLLNLLLSGTTFIDNVMQVVWAGKMSPQPK